MISISKSKLKKTVFLVLPLTILTILSALFVMDMEGAFADSRGQLNNPITITCASGILANREVHIAEDGEYNWMFAKGQEIRILASLDTVMNNSVRISFSRGPDSVLLKDGLLHSSEDKIDWTFQIPSSGHWRLELVNYSGLVVPVRLHVTAGSFGFWNSQTFGLLNCLDPGDLFRWDGD